MHSEYFDINAIFNYICMKIELANDTNLENNYYCEDVNVYFRDLILDYEFSKVTGNLTYSNSIASKVDFNLGVRNIGDYNSEDFNVYIYFISDSNRDNYDVFNYSDNNIDANETLILSNSEYYWLPNILGYIDINIVAISNQVDYNLENNYIFLDNYYRVVTSDGDTKKGGGGGGGSGGSGAGSQETSKTYNFIVQQNNSSKYYVGKEINIKLADNNNVIVPKVNVTITNPDNTIKTFETNNLGQFSFTPLQAGIYILSFVSDGKTYTKTIDVLASSISEYDNSNGNKDIVDSSNNTNNENKNDEINNAIKETSTATKVILWTLGSVAVVALLVWLGLHFFNRPKTLVYNFKPNN
jgi:hypothetical protein